MDKRDLEQLTVRIPRKDIRTMEELIDKEIFSSKSHVVRRGIKLVLQEHQKRILA